MNQRKNLTIAIILILIGFSMCKKDPLINDTEEEFKCATPFELDLDGNFPPFEIPEENPLTEEGIELGRHLFYDPILSGDNTQSCASCHQQESNFVDKDQKLSVGINGVQGFRNSMPLVNLIFADRFFWDGNSRSLEELIAVPIEAEFEMHENLFDAIKELQETDKYPGMFANAFCDSVINVERMSFAIAQFLRTIVAYAPGASSVPSVRNQALNQQELAGFEVFIDETKGDCFHCHTVTLVNTTNTFLNNGLLADIEGTGLASVTGDSRDDGKFKVPSLINLRYTAPYMHDGRFNSLIQVINHYDTGFHFTRTLDPNLKKQADSISNEPVPRRWSEQDKANLITYLLSLEDKSILSDPAFSKPE